MQARILLVATLGRVKRARLLGRSVCHVSATALVHGQGPLKLSQRNRVASAAERLACKGVRFGVHFARYPSDFDVGELLNESTGRRAQLFEILGVDLPVIVDGVDDERRVGEHPYPIDPMATSKLETFDESFVLRYVVVPHPSDLLRQLIDITVLRIFQHHSDRGRTRGTVVGGYPAVGLQHVEAGLRRGGNG